MITREEYLEKIKKTKIINESSLSKIINHIESDRNFAVISAYRGSNNPLGWQLDYPELKKEFIKSEYDKDQAERKVIRLNYQAHDKLYHELKKLGFGIIEQGSGYEGIEEKSYFIPNISYEKAFEISKEYKQQSMIWKDKDFFGIIYTNDFTDEDGIKRKEHDKGISFKREIKNGVITFNDEVLKNAYSKLLKASYNQRRKFAYVIKESSDHFGVYEKIEPPSFSGMTYAIGHSDEMNKYLDILNGGIFINK